MWFKPLGLIPSTHYLNSLLQEAEIHLARFHLTLWLGVGVTSGTVVFAVCLLRITVNERSSGPGWWELHFNFISLPLSSYVVTRCIQS